MNSQEKNLRNDIYVNLLDLYGASKLEHYRSIVRIGKIVDQDLSCLDFVTYMGVITASIKALKDINKNIVSSFKDRACKTLLDTLCIFAFSNRNSEEMLTLGIIPCITTLLTSPCDFVKLASMRLLRMIIYTPSVRNNLQTHKCRPIVLELLSSNNIKIVENSRAILTMLAEKHFDKRPCFFKIDASLREYYHRQNPSICHRYYK